MNLKDLHTKILYTAYFFFSWAIGFTAYSNSTVIESINGRSGVGFIYGISAALALVLSTWVIPNIIIKLGNRKTVGLAISLMILASIGIKYLDNPTLFGIAFIMFLATQILISFSFDIFFEHNSNRDSSAKTRGSMVSLQHVGRMLGPIMAAVITVKMGMRAPYTVLMVLMVFCGILLYFSTKKFRDKSYIPGSIIKSFDAIKSRPAVRKSLFSLLMLHIFYALMVTFVPIYLSDVKNIGTESLGLIFTIMLTPFVLLGYPIGKQIDSGVSGRRMARTGIFIMAITTLMFPFIETTSIVIWGAILLLSRVGAVMLETAGDGIFFKNINEEETELLGIMRDMQPLGYFIASFLSIIVLWVGQIDHIFYVVGLILTLGIISTRKKHAHQ